MLRLTHGALPTKRALSLRSALLFAGIGMLPLSSSAPAHNSTYFGGRLGRPGGDSRYFLYSWNRGPTGGTLTWFLARGELTYGQCDAACFGTLNNLVPPELAMPDTARPTFAGASSASCAKSKEQSHHPSSTATESTSSLERGRPALFGS